MAYNRVWNKEVNDYSYEFILFYPDFSVSVQTTDSAQSDYSYHHFEIDLLFSDKRKTLIDISQAIRNVSITDYAYSGVKVSNDREAQVSMTGYNTSMIDTVGYIAEISRREKKHSINTPRDSYNNQLILDNIVASYRNDCKKIRIETEQWKK